MQHPPLSDNLETQRGINVRLIAAQERYSAAQSAYHRDPSKLDEYMAAAEELRSLRSQPMVSLAPMLPKRFAKLEE